MKRIHVKEEFLALKKEWSPKVIASLNDNQVRIALVQGEYHWHRHLHSEEEPH